MARQPHLKIKSWDQEGETMKTSYLSDLFVVLTGLEVAERRYLGLYAEDLSAGVVDVQGTYCPCAMVSMIRM
jgi:hypothetical protein